MTAHPVPAPPGSPDDGVPWHYGDPHAEQRSLAAGDAWVDLSHLGVLRVTGADRIDWLHSLTTADLLSLRTAPGSALALLLDPHGHIEHELHVIDDGTATWLIVEPSSRQDVAEYLDRMRFMLDVAVEDVTEQYAVVWSSRSDLADGSATVEGVPTWRIPGDFSGGTPTPAGSDRGGDATGYVPLRPGVLVGAELVVPRAELPQVCAGLGLPAGTWALEALRVAAGVPRAPLDIDHRSLPHELGWIGPAVHLSKGCYRGQETVARVHNMGRPPRRLALLHLDGSAEELPTRGSEIVLDEGGRPVGYVGTVARHHELGPIALAVLKRNVDLPGDVIAHSASGTPIAARAEAIVLR